MAKILVKRYHRKQGKKLVVVKGYYRKIGIPQALGTRWYTKAYIHGPRITEPEKFSAIWIKDKSLIKKNKKQFKGYEKIPKELLKKKSVKIKVGILKKGGLGVQSVLIPKFQAR